MSLTPNQKHNLNLALWIGGAVLFVVGGCIAVFAFFGGSTQAATVNPPQPPQVNASHLEQINTVNGDGRVDHYCVGTDGLFFGAYTGEFSAMKNDPLCGG